MSASGGLGMDINYVITSPSRWEKKDWGICIGLGVGIYGIMSQDEKIQDFIKSNEVHCLGDAVASYCTPLSDGLVASGIMGGAYICGSLLNNEKLKETANMGLESILITGGIVNCIKLIAGRARPSVGKGAFSWIGPTLSHENMSFPSGHTSIAFTLASVFESQYKSPIIDFVAYGLASLVAWSRINDNTHWTSDVLVGAIIGISVGKAITNNHRK